MSKPIELMHVYFGENKNTCGTCCNLVEVIRGRKKLRKCKAYGGFHSSKADWAKKWVACGLYGEHVPQPMVSDVERLRLHANCMMDEWESTLCKRSEFITAANRIEQLRAELTNERIDNTNLIGELATVTAERDRYKAEHENPQPLTLEEVKEHITKGHPNDIKPLYVDFKPTIPIDYASRWRDAYNLSRLIAGRGDEYGKTWIAYRSKPKEENT